jgi:transposase-like protein
MAKFTFREFQAEYPNDDACLAKLMEVQFGGTEITCPACGADSKFHLMHKRKAYACQHCGHHIYPCAGTIFHKSRTKLTHWFFAMYLMTSTRHGVAAKELQRQLGVTYKCAWRMAHELRKLMANADHRGKLSGHVEIDETLVGGRQRGKGHKSKMANKTVVFGMAERKGKLRAGPIPDATRYTVVPIVQANVTPGSTVSTDEHHGYDPLSKLGFAHGTVQHTSGEYVKGIHHTNTIEGHWSLFKRAVSGTHVHISAKHLWKYVAEFNYRHNYRLSHSTMFNRLVSAFALPRLKET